MYRGNLVKDLYAIPFIDYSWNVIGAIFPQYCLFSRTTNRPIHTSLCCYISGLFVIEKRNVILQRVARFSMTRYQQNRGWSSRERGEKKSWTGQIWSSSHSSISKNSIRTIIHRVSQHLCRNQKLREGGRARKYMYTFNFTNELRINFINEPWWTLITIGNCRITLVISRLWCILLGVVVVRAISRNR